MASSSDPHSADSSAVRDLRLVVSKPRRHLGDKLQLLAGRAPELLSMIESYVDLVPKELKNNW